MTRLICYFILSLLITLGSGCDTGVTPNAYRVTIDLAGTRTMALPKNYSGGMSSDDTGPYFSARRADSKVVFYYRSVFGNNPYYSSLPDSFVYYIPTVPDPILQVYPHRVPFRFQNSFQGMLYHKDDSGSAAFTRAMVVVQNSNDPGFTWVLWVDYDFTLQEEVMGILSTMMYPSLVTTPPADGPGMPS